MEKLNVLIIEDHQLVAEAWKMILESHKEFETVHFCRSADEGISFLDTFKPDIILLDVNLPGTSGIEAIPAILNASPQSRIIGLSIHALPVYAKQMMAKGAHGYLTKSSTSKEFLDAIKQVMKGEKYICTEIRNILSATIIQSELPVNADINRLTKREREVLNHIKEGLTSKEIAQKMGLSVRTVEVHRYNILKKLNLNNSSDLVALIHEIDPLI